MSIRPPKYLLDDNSRTEYAAILSLAAQESAVAAPRILIAASADFAAKLAGNLPAAEIVTAGLTLPDEADFTLAALRTLLGATRNLLEAEIEREEDGESTPYDLVIIPRLLEAIAEPSPLLALIARRLAPYGKFITTSLNAGYWRIIADLGRGSFRFYDRFMYAKQELEAMLYASFFKDVAILPLPLAADGDDGEREKFAAFVAKMAAAGLAKADDARDLAANFFLVSAAVSLPEIAYLKSHGTREQREELSVLARRAEYDVGNDAAENLWELLENAGFSPVYAANFFASVSLAPEKIIAALKAAARSAARQDFLAQSEISLDEAKAVYGAENIDDLLEMPLPESEAISIAPPPADYPPPQGEKKQTIVFVTCVNDESKYAECLRYIDALDVPPAWEVKKIAMRGAQSMAAGYEAARRSAVAQGAAIIAYLHQDVLIINKKLISDLAALFFRAADIGLIGVIGCLRLPRSGSWWEGRRLIGRVIHAVESESVVDTRHGEPEQGKGFQRVEAVDGLFIATRGAGLAAAEKTRENNDYNGGEATDSATAGQKAEIVSRPAASDIAWRRDLFTGWHFYDSSICREYWRAGCSAAIPDQRGGAWCIHRPTEKPLDASYYRYRRIFLKEYGGELKPEV